jgi:hypothetical protein
VEEEPYEVGGSKDKLTAGGLTATLVVGAGGAAGSPGETGTEAGVREVEPGEGGAGADAGAVGGGAENCAASGKRAAGFTPSARGFKTETPNGASKLVAGEREEVCWSCPI